MSHNDLDYAGRRLQLLGTRVVEPELSGSGHRVLTFHPHQHHHRRTHSHDDTEDTYPEKGPSDTPKFHKSHSASNFELFYDLWFVANLNVFTTVHEISDFSNFVSFIGYMVLLWTTWVMTTLYDVRFTADSVFERVCKAIHLGVMIGFSEIGTNFDPNDQIVSVFRTMSLFLAVSRFVLFIQYGVVLIQIRKYSHGKRPMLATALLHLCASAIYFGVSFRYNLGKSSKVYLVWYIGGVVEALLHLSLSQVSHVLTFLGTHLGERMNLLTLVILGEGCIILAKSITLLVKDTFLKDATYTLWSPALIGLVTAGTALIYIIFQLYFDWMHEEHSMSKRHQVWWTALHLPFHIALVLLLEAASQFVVWARIIESANAAVKKINDALEGLEKPYESEELSETLAGVIEPFLEKYQPLDAIDTWKSVNETLADIADIPNSLWESTPDDDDPIYVRFQTDLNELAYAMLNAVYNAFGIEAPEEEDIPKDRFWQSEAVIEIAKRFILVFIYGFACAGIVLLFLTIMHIISKRRGWSPFNIFRTAICIALSIVLALLSTFAANEEAVINKERKTAFVGSSWMLPTIVISYFLVLVMTHLPHPKFCMGNFKRGTYKEVGLPPYHENHALTSMPKKNYHPADYEDRRTGYSSADQGTVSPPTPRYDDRKPRPHTGDSRRSRRSHERRVRDNRSRERRQRRMSGGMDGYM
ncbi:uncharacterized protein F4822DRAFT_325776 [Hypoxylon trugodes]|uniref:uncharacterized protein n=1 Tax=Hypoxylon trugodes TaxID=326681 RepID=UPI00219EAA38|nr:uncharacterized protein F4822DRAFT_325776 [Hypoxylon trugodes]KAI1386763.1 hypothetical protein F4822DRAFT_325776 [Hypoxylon trugodes]